MCLSHEKCHTTLEKHKKTKSKNNLNQEYLHRYVRSKEISLEDLLQIIM